MFKALSARSIASRLFLSAAFWSILILALAGLGLILQELGDDAHALEAYRRALAINPHLEHVGETVKTLREKVEGRDI